MNRNLKKLLALLLAVVMLLPTLVGCQAGSAGETTEPEVTQSPEEAKVLKILTLGHSLTVDSCHMLALVAAKEGYEHMMVGTLYESGCKLAEHVQFLTNNEPAYNLYISSTETPDKIPTITEGVTMHDALNFDYWDIIIMQGGVFEAARESSFKFGAVQVIQNYVKENISNPAATLAWHMTWVTPTDNDLRDMYSKTPNSYYKSYEEFNDDRTTFYNARIKCLKDYILTDENFEFVIPSGTAIENALSSYLTEKDLHRDYAHASDLGRVIASYTWYCTLAGIDHLEEIKLDAIPKNFLKSTQDKTQDRVLTDAEKAIIIESVNNALKNPLEVTQSQYTEAPAQ